MIELRDVQFAYSVGAFRLQIDRLSVANGQHTCWVGPSGSGKTTLMHLVAGIRAVESGSVETLGVELTSLGDAARRNFRITNVGLVFQDFALLDYLSVMDNILLPYRISPELRLDASVRDRAEKLAVGVGLGAMLSRKPTALSHGERQRVAVCRAVVARPKLLLADEPTANLDPPNASRVLDALEEYASEHQATLVVVSHDRDVIARFRETTDITRWCRRPESELAGGRRHA